VLVRAFDFDGVLAEKPEASVKKWGVMNGVERQARQDYLAHHYGHCQPLLNPDGDDAFYVITARKNEPRFTSPSWSWLQKHFAARVAGVYFLDQSRTLDNVARFKADALVKCKAKVFVEDNRQILKRLARLAPTVRLLFWDATMLGKPPTPFYP
jgi:hypothetical protein